MLIIVLLYQFHPITRDAAPRPLVLRRRCRCRGICRCVRRVGAAASLAATARIQNACARGLSRSCARFPKGERPRGSARTARRSGEKSEQTEKLRKEVEDLRREPDDEVQSGDRA